MIITACIVWASWAAALGQVADVVKTIPEGKWVLKMESVHAIIGCRHDSLEDLEEDHVHVDHEVNLNDIDIEIYANMEVRQDSIILKSSKNTLKTKYVYTKKSGIRFDSADIPFNPGGNVFGNLLYVQQRIVNPANENEEIFISFVYEYKPD